MLYKDCLQKVLSLVPPCSNAAIFFYKEIKAVKTGTVTIKHAYKEMPGTGDLPSLEQ